MQKPIEQTSGYSLLSKLKTNLSTFKERKVNTFKVLPQMPSKQISHFAKQVVHDQTPITIQINNNGSVAEYSGAPSVSNRSGHLVIKESKSNIYHLIKANTIRHIRK